MKNELPRGSAPAGKVTVPPLAAPVRQLGLTTATALVVANMIGSGVFTTSGFLLGDLGSPGRVLAAWAVGGLIALLGALSYSALAREIPESGGEYLFLARTLHPAAGYLAGWVSLLVGFSAPLAAVAMAFGEYTKAWLPGWHPKVTGTVLLVLFAMVHAVHVQRGAWIQNATVIVKLILIGVFLGFGFSRLQPPVELAAGDFSFGTFAVSLVWVSFSYFGWNAAVYVGGEIRDPERTMPRAMLWGTLLVTALYLALNAVFVYSAPRALLAGKLDVGRIAAEALGGRAWADGITVIVALALITSVSAMVMAGPRVYARMAADGYLPRWLAPTDGPPRNAIALQLALALVLLWSAAFESLLTYIGFTLNLCTAATVVGLIRLRRKAGDRLRVTGWPWVPGLFLAFVAWMTVFTVARRPWESAVGLGTLAIGWLAWRWSRVASSPAGKQSVTE
jgi:APA family basic amino acid/polyamine antiporter